MDKVCEKRWYMSGFRDLTKMIRSHKFKNTENYDSSIVAYKPELVQVSA